MKNKLFKIIDTTLALLLIPLIIFIWCGIEILYVAIKVRRDTRIKELKELIDVYTTERSA